jgi:hypothetical protein
MDTDLDSVEFDLAWNRMKWTHPLAGYSSSYKIEEMYFTYCMPAPRLRISPYPNLN